MTNSFEKELGSERRRITVRQFKGSTLIDIREYYKKDDEWKPGSKGISLTPDQWAILAECAPEVSKAINKAKPSTLKQEDEDELPKKRKREN
ncbi:hypothetical protein DAMA08_007830 [Martiniozyma asiatica (nom. inval.)]|nr:hypothetical protein DAMA08_007830 [Martiniozyma asiatica]